MNADKYTLIKRYTLIIPKSMILFLIVLLFAVNWNSEAQIFELGPVVGYGEIGDGPFLPFRYCNAYKYNNFVRTGISGNLSFKSSAISLKTGITYNQILNSTSESLYHLKFMQLPVGFDLRMGKKFYGLAGTGIVINSTFKKSTHLIKYPAFQLGLSANLGLGYSINKRMNINLEYQYEYNITALYATRYRGVYEESRSINRIFYVNLKIRISKNT